MGMACCTVTQEDKRGEAMRARAAAGEETRLGGPERAAEQEHAGALPVVRALVAVGGGVGAGHGYRHGQQREREEQPARLDCPWRLDCNSGLDLGRVLAQPLAVFARVAPRLVVVRVVRGQRRVRVAGLVAHRPQLENFERSQQ
jgi:hypothetical protein